MERFNYPNLAAVDAEDASILWMLDAEQYGYKADEQEERDRMQAEIEAMKDGS